MKALTGIYLEDGVHVSGQTLKSFSVFEEHYLNIRNKEKRVLSIPEIRRLPYADRSNPHYKEWRLRQKNIERLLAYLHRKNAPLRILDIGCGNGFMTHLMAGNKNEAIGLDVNLTELKQAAAAFPGKNLKWYYLDILNESLPEKPFDIITFGASFQYFKNAGQILEICKTKLSKTGEIHIIDSPFYNEAAKIKASERSEFYFHKMGVKEMAAHYNHHSFEVFGPYAIEIKYNPHAYLRKIFRLKDSPFLWIKIR